MCHDFGGLVYCLRVSKLSEHILTKPCLEHSKIWAKYGNEAKIGFAPGFGRVCPTHTCTTATLHTVKDHVRRGRVANRMNQMERA